MSSVSNLEVPFPPNPNPRAPKLIAPPGSWDTHFHVFGPPNLFPYAESRRYTPPAAPVEHWLEIASAIGISRGLLVTPSVHDLDPAVTLEAIRKSDGRLRGVIRANNELTTDEIRRLHAGGIRGLRFPFAKVVRRSFDEKQVHVNIASIAPFSWFAEFQIDGDALEQHAELIANAPVPVMIDGFGGIEPKDGLDQPAFRTLLDLLGRPNIWLKMIGADRQLREGTRYEDIVAMSRAVIARAPDRIIWGTDWPTPIFTGRG